jgi:hypothetical protein
MTVIVLDSAAEDIIAGRDFYNDREPGMGEYFVGCIQSDLPLLADYAGIHSVHFGFYRMLSRRFPFGIYYEIEGHNVIVYAILDMRRDPLWLRAELARRQ